MESIKACFPCVPLTGMLEGERRRQTTIAPALWSILSIIFIHILPRFISTFFKYCFVQTIYTRFKEIKINTLSLIHKNSKE